MFDAIQLLAELNQAALRKVDLRKADLREGNSAERTDALLKALQTSLAIPACFVWFRNGSSLVQHHSVAKHPLSNALLQEIQTHVLQTQFPSSVRLRTDPALTLMVIPSACPKEKLDAPVSVLAVLFDQTLPPVNQAQLLRALTIVTSWIDSRKDEGDPFPLALNLFRTTSYQDAITAIVNHGLRVTQSDRVTLFRFQGKRFTCEAISGEAYFDRHANVVRTQEAWVAARLSASGNWHYPNDLEYAPQEESRLSEYLDHSPITSAALVSLHAHNSMDGENCSERNADTMIGALLVESFTHHDSSLFQQSLAKYAPIAEVAFQQALLLKAAWYWPGKKGVQALSKNSKSLWVWGTVIAVLCLITGFIRVPLRIEAQGSVQPVARRHVFAQTDGIVQQVHVEEGTPIRKGALLLTLESPELDQRLIELRGELETIQQRIRDLKRIRLKPINGPDIAQEPEIQLASELQQLDVQRLSLETRLTLLAEEQKHLEIRAPIDGTILNWDPKQNLIGRPVNRGQSLLEIADINGPWRAELHILDRQSGPVLENWYGENKQSLKVDYYFANAPETRHLGNVSWIAQSAQVHEGKHGVLVHVPLAPRQHEPYIAGTRVTARIHSQRISLAWLALRDLVAVLDREIFFRFFPSLLGRS